MHSKVFESHIFDQKAACSVSSNMSNILIFFNFLFRTSWNKVLIHILKIIFIYFFQISISPNIPKYVFFNVSYLKLYFNHHIKRILLQYLKENFLPYTRTRIAQEVIFQLIILQKLIYKYVIDQSQLQKHLPDVTRAVDVDLEAKNLSIK